MVLAFEWLILHIFGVIVAFALLITVAGKEETRYKAPLLLAIVCCLVTLVSKCLYIMGGSEETLLALGKLEYLGKCFANYCCLMFMIRWRDIKIPNWVGSLLLLINLVFYVLIATVDLNHLYYKDYWLTESNMNLGGYTLEITPALAYYIYMAFLAAEIACSAAIIISSFQARKNSPIAYKINLHFMLLCSVLSPMILLSLRLIGILKGDDPTPLGILASCIFMSLAVVKFGLFDPIKKAKDYIIEDLGEGLIVLDAEKKFLFLNSMAEDLVESIKENNSIQTDIELYDLLKGENGYLDWQEHHYQVEEKEMKKGVVTQGYMLTIMDITELMEQNQMMKELVEQAETANQAKSAFVSNISHEIRTPMNSIVGMTELMLRHQHEPTEQEYLINIQSSGQALLTIINDVLDFSKIESGKMEIFSEDYNTFTMFRDIKLILEDRIKGKPIRLYYEIDQNLPYMLCGDAGRIRQVIMNLAGNAIKYTEKGFIRVRVRILEKSKDTVKLSYEIEDSGIGIRKEDMNILFDSFQRVDMKKNRQIEGTGLGLTISQNLVKMMGGTIQIESVYGEGSRFSFCIEQKVVDATPISESEYVDAYVNVADKEAENFFIAPKARILLVDDNELNLLVAKELMKPLQLQIDTAINGAQAVEQIQKQHYDLVLMDHMMPVMDGIEATRIIRNMPEPEYSKIPIIALTANAMVNARKEFIQAEMNGFIAKPIDFNSICTALRTWLPEEVVQEVSREEAIRLISGEKTAEVNWGYCPEDGIRYCGSKEGLLQAIQCFYRTIDSKTDKISRCLQERQIKDYTIEVHSLKSAALLIGAKELSERARELEEYGKAQDIQTLEKKTPALLAMYREYKTILRPYIEEVKDHQEVSIGEWIEKLQEMNRYMEEFDIDQVDDIMGQLEQYQVPSCVQEDMERLRVYIADVAIEDVLRMTNEMIEKLNG